MNGKKEQAQKGVKDGFIQVWRGIAVVLVVAYHFTNRVPHEYLSMDNGPSVVFYSGKIGVLIFFVISGYLITKSLGHSASLGSFYAKRISRIWPLFILASVMIFLFLQFAQPPIVPGGSKKFFAEDRTLIDLAGSIFFLEDLGFRWMDGVFWSVLVELKYYFWIGLLAYLRPGSFVRDFAFVAIAISALVIVLGLLEKPFLKPVETALNGIFIAQYLSYFAIGALLTKKANRDLLSVLLIIALLQAFIKSTANPDFEMQDTLVFGMLLATIVFADAALFQSRIFLIIGEYSYAFYLFHQIIGLSIIKALGGIVSYDLALVVALAVTFAIAAATSWAAEWRFRKLFSTGLMYLFGRLRLDQMTLGCNGSGLPKEPA